MIANPFSWFRNRKKESPPPEDQKTIHHPSSERLLYIDGWPTIGTYGEGYQLSSAPSRGQAYVQVDVLFTVINRIAKNCAAVKLEIFKKGDREPITLDDPRGADRKVIKVLELMQNGDPNFLPYSFDMLREMMHTARMVDGNGYLYIPPSTLTGAPLMVKYIPPQFVTPETDPVGQRVIWNPVKYRYGGGVSVDAVKPGQYFEENSIYHILDVIDPWRPAEGISPLRSLTMDVNILVDGKEFNLKTMRTGGRIPGAFTTEGEEPSDEGKAKIREMFDQQRDTNHPLVLWGADKYLPFGFNPKDLEWLGALRISTQAIANAYGYPARLLMEQNKGLVDTEFEIALDYYYGDTVIPTVEMEANLFTSFFFGGGSKYFFKPNVNAIEAVKRARMKKLKDLSGVDGFVSVNEKREAAGLEPLEDSRGNLVLTSSANTLSDLAMLGDDKFDREDL